MAHVVTAAGLVAKMQNDTGEGYLYRGDVVPAAVSKTEVKRLLDLGLIKEAEVVLVEVVEPAVAVVDPATDASEPAAEPEPTPARKTRSA